MTQPKILANVTMDTIEITVRIFVWVMPPNV
jgi:hypothetical protein